MHITNVKQALLNDYNKANNIKPAVTLNDVQWDNIEIWLQGDCNSRVTIRALPTSTKFTNSQVLYFNRRPIEKDLFGIKIPGKPSEYNTNRDVLRVLKNTLGVPVEADEFIEQNISGDTVLLVPSARCMAYLPNSSVVLEFVESD